MKKISFFFIIIFIAGATIFSISRHYNQKKSLPEKKILKTLINEKSLILVAAQEETGDPVPCTLWKVNKNKQSLGKIQEIPNIHVSTITHYPDDRVLLIWGYELQINEKGIWGDAPEKGFIRVIEESNPATCKTIKLDFDPLFRGHFIHKKTGERLIYIETSPEIKKVLGQEEPFYVINIDTMKRTKSTDFPLDEASIPGYIWARNHEGRRATCLRIRAEENGQMYTQFGWALNCISNLIIPADILQSLDEEAYRRFGSVYANNKFIIMRSSVKKNDNQYNPVIVIYDKRKKIWDFSIHGKETYSEELKEWHIIVPGVLTNVLETQLFNNWLAFPGGFYEYNKTEKNYNMIVTGHYAFYNIETNRYFFHYFGEPGVQQNYPVKINDDVFVKYNETTMAPEVLLISQGKIYYRRGNILYEADFSENGLKNPKELVRDNIIPLVHWAFLSEMH